MTTQQVELAPQPDDDVIWSKRADGEELLRLINLHPDGTLYLTTEDDPRYVCGYIEAVSIGEESNRSVTGRFISPDDTIVLTLTDPMGVRILEPDETVLVGVAGPGGGHVGHMSWGGSNWWCDTCDSPLCDLA